MAELARIGFAHADGKVFRVSDKVRALELLGRHLGVFDSERGADGENKAKYLLVVPGPYRKDTAEWMRLYGPGQTLQLPPAETKE